jgi:hypothetical protein
MFNMQKIKRFRFLVVLFLLNTMAVFSVDFSPEEYMLLNITESWAQTSQRWLEYIVTHQYNFKPEEIEAAKHELALRSKSMQLSEEIRVLVEEYKNKKPSYKSLSTGDVFIKIGKDRGISFRQMVTQDEVYEMAIKYDVEPEVIVLYNAIKNKITERYGEPKTITSIDLKTYKTIVENQKRRTEVIILKNIKLIYESDVEIYIFSDEYYIDSEEKVQIFNNAEEMEAENIKELSDYEFDRGIDAITRALNLVNVIWQKTFSLSGIPMLKGSGLLAYYYHTYWLVLSEDGFNEIVHVK